MLGKILYFTFPLFQGILRGEKEADHETAENVATYRSATCRPPAGSLRR